MPPAPESSPAIRPAETPSRETALSRLFVDKPTTNLDRPASSDAARPHVTARAVSSVLARLSDPKLAGATGVAVVAGCVGILALARGIGGGPEAATADRPEPVELLIEAGWPEDVVPVTPKAIADTRPHHVPNVPHVPDVPRTVTPSPAAAPAPAPVPPVMTMRRVGLNYFVLNSTRDRAEAERLATRARDKGIECSIESALAGYTRPGWFSVVTTRGFDLPGDRDAFNAERRRLAQTGYDAPAAYKWR